MILKQVSQTKFLTKDLIPWLEENLPTYVSAQAQALEESIDSPGHYLFGWRDPFDQRTDAIIVMPTRSTETRTERLRQLRVLLVVVAVKGQPDTVETRASAYVDALTNLLEADPDMNGAAFASELEEVQWLASPAGAERMSVVMMRISVNLSSL